MWAWFCINLSAFIIKLKDRCYLKFVICSIVELMENTQFMKIGLRKYIFAQIFYRDSKFLANE